MKTDRIRIFFAAGVASVLIGCVNAKPPPPLRSAATFRPEQMDVVHILPVVDARADRSLNTDFNKIIQNSAAGYLKRQGYQAKTLSAADAGAAIAPDDVREATPEWVKQTGPSGSRWVMIFVIEELSRSIKLGSTGNAEVILSILDRQTGEVVWYDKGLGRVGQGGLIGTLEGATMDDGAVKAAVNNLLWKIPKKPKAE
jgi:hypothetical protein